MSFVTNGLHGNELNAYCDREYASKWLKKKYDAYLQRRREDCIYKAELEALQQEYTELLDKPFKEQLQIVMTGEFHKPAPTEPKRKAKTINGKHRVYDDAEKTKYHYE